MGAGGRQIGSGKGASSVTAMQWQPNPSPLHGPNTAAEVLVGTSEFASTGPSKPLHTVDYPNVKEHLFPYPGTSTTSSLQDAAVVILASLHQQQLG